MRFILNEDDYDYGTKSVTGNEFIDISKASNTGMQDILNKKNAGYYRKNKNKKSEIVYMSPQQYYEECAKGFGTTVSSLKVQRGIYDKETIEELKDVLLVKKKQFPLPYIDYTGFGQEGLHRMYAIGEIVGWDKPQPVQIVDFYDKKLEQERKYKEEQYEKEIESFNNIKEYIEWEEDLFSHGIDFFVDNVRDYIEKKFGKQESRKISVEESNDDESIHIYYNGNYYSNVFYVRYSWFEKIDEDEIDDYITYDSIDDAFISDLSDEEFNAEINKLLGTGWLDK